MNTNGAIQSTFFWHALGLLFNQPQDYCVFSIDGLEDTNHVYRKNVNWEKLMSNVQAYIAAGGSAHWDMLVYKHNQHQVDACEQLARDMGFKWFRAKVSKRGFTDRLEFPIGWQQPTVKSGPIKCHVLNEKSVYIDAQGRVSACCWLGATQQDFVKDDLATVKLTYRESETREEAATGNGSVDAIYRAIEKATGWHMEIMGSRANVDDEMISKYNKFDPYAWEKVKNSDEWQDAIYKVAYISGRAMDLAVQQIAQPVGRDDKTKESIRKFLWSAWKALDLRFSK
jgi:hypothetical protein